MIPYKTILIHAAKEQRFQSLLGMGIELSRRFQSHLIGLAVMPPPLRIPAGVPGAADVVSLDSHLVAYRDEARRMGSAFQRAVAADAISSDWILDEGSDAGLEADVLEYARATDLLICGTPDAGSAGLPRQKLTERLILGCGRPVLVVPRSHVPALPLGGRVLIAWNGSREATRAAFDALPILRTARDVKVLSIGAESDGDVRSPQQLCNILSRHDVRARPEVLSLPGADIGSAMLSCVKAENADLLVMGCYGHPRLYEYALGGATRHVLLETPVPVLMSH